MDKETNYSESSDSEDQDPGISPKNFIYAFNILTQKKIKTLKPNETIKENGIELMMFNVACDIDDYKKSDKTIRDNILKHFEYCSTSKNLLFDYPPFNFDSLIDLCTEGIMMKPKSSDAYLFRAKAKELSGDTSGAISDLDKAIELNPKEANLYNERGQLKESSGHRQEAIADFKKMMLYKSSPELLDYMRMSTFKALTFDFMGSLEDLNKAVDLDPTDAKPYFSRACLKALLKDSKGAIEDFNNSITFDPNYEDSYFFRGFEKMVINDFEGALTDFNTIKGKNDIFLKTYFCLVLAKLETNDLLGAVVDFFKAKTIKPNPHSKHYKTNIEFCTSEKYKFSIAGFEKYISTDSVRAKSYLAHLISLSKDIDTILPDDVDGTIIKN